MCNILLAEIDVPITNSNIIVYFVFSKSLPKYILSLISLVEDALRTEFLECLG